jgi:predicted peroxiredoxin
MKPIYHGTIKKNLKTIKPFKRYTPGGESLADSIPARIYATYIPAYAAAHSFPWSSDDGVDIFFEGETVTLIVPEEKKEILEQEICIYTLPDDGFILTTEEAMNLTYHSEKEITPIEMRCFQNVPEAMKKYGGVIKFI